MNQVQDTHWQLNHLDFKLIDLALIEDLGLPFNDITTDLLFSKSKQRAKACLVSKHPGPIKICGLKVVNAILSKFTDAQCLITSSYQDGQILLPGESLLTLEGQACALLMAERIVLNFLQRLSAIATLTAKYVQAVSHTDAKILDTRKTMPGFRHLEKYAVYCGGGTNHRMGLYDAIMIKDTHIDLLGGMSETISKLPDKVKNTAPVIVEVRTMEELNLVLTQGRQKISRVLLDNMSPELMVQCVNKCRGEFSTEASGNICLENIKAVAECGVDFISIGKLTHSAGSVDLSMKCE